MNYCSNCGTKLELQNKFCSGCGAALKNATIDAVNKPLDAQPGIEKDSSSAKTKPNKSLRKVASFIVGGAVLYGGTQLAGYIIAEVLTAVDSQTVQSSSAESTYTFEDHGFSAKFASKPSINNSEEDFFGYKMKVSQFTSHKSILFIYDASEVINSLDLNDEPYFDKDLVTKFSQSPKDTIKGVKLISSDEEGIGDFSGVLSIFNTENTTNSSPSMSVFATADTAKMYVFTDLEGDTERLIRLIESFKRI